MFCYHQIFKIVFLTVPGSWLVGSKVVMSECLSAGCRLYSWMGIIEQLQCDQNDYRASCKVSLNKHIAKEHNVIPQIDGLTEYNAALEEKSVQTENLKVSDSEAQTQFTDTDVTVKWG